MTPPFCEPDPLVAHLKQLLTRKFRLSNDLMDNIALDEPLIGSRLGLDSLDALEFGLCVEEEFGVTIGTAAELHTTFASIASLAGFLRHRAAPTPVAPPAGLPMPVPATS